MKPELNKIVNPNKAPIPIQYQYASVKNPRELRIKTPNVSFVYGTTLGRNPKSVSFDT